MIPRRDIRRTSSDNIDWRLCLTQTISSPLLPGSSPLSWRPTSWYLALEKDNHRYWATDSHSSLDVLTSTTRSTHNMYSSTPSSIDASVTSATPHSASKLNTRAESTVWLSLVCDPLRVFRVSSVCPRTSPATRRRKLWLNLLRYGSV